jgi:glycosyltransferase involved in cell wall biosynthesis
MFSSSVVITTKNRKEELLKAVESAMAQRGLLEVIVIDDGSTDDTARFIERISAENEWQAATQPMTDGESLRTDEIDKNRVSSLNNQLSAISYPPSTMAKPLLRLIRHEESRGLIVRRNEGARVARGNVIFSLDDDAFFSSPFVVEQTLLDFSHPRIGAVAIPYIEPHKANKEMQRAPTREDIWITASYIGTAHAVRRDVFLALGGYREHLVHQGEEGDFCIRMLATELKNEAGLTTEHTEGTEDQAGLCLDKPSCAAFSKPSTSELARDSENTLLIRSADGPASSPATSHSLPVTAPEVPGFFVRLGNSDVIIHNESPKRDYSRMDFYGRRNDVLFHWQNTPMPDLLWQLPKTIAGGLVCAAKVGRWRKMLEGIGAGFLAIAGGVKREPVPNNYSEIYHQLKKKGPIRMIQ